MVFFEVQDVKTKEDRELAIEYPEIHLYSRKQ